MTDRVVMLVFSYPGYVTASELEHSPSQWGYLPRPGIATRSEPSRHKGVKAIHVFAHRERAGAARVLSGTGRALCHAAGLDGAGSSRGQARGDSGSPGPNHEQVGAQSIEPGGNCARLRPTVQAGGGATELARRCGGAPLAALVPGQGGGSNRLCVGHWLDADR